jgi:alpha-methylacyl-CoA racemase
VRIVSLAQNVPGPVAVARLVRGGAAAVKIEPPAGDQLAMLCPEWYRELHDGVEVERLDLKTDAGRAALAVRLQSCDVLIASQRPQALVRLGLDHAAMAARFPHVRHLNIVGDTQDPERAGHDLTYLAQQGLVRGTVMPLTLVADLVGAERAYAAVLELMQQAPGSHRVVGLADAVRDVAAPLRHGLTAPGGPLGGGNAAYRLYATRDGGLAVAALEPHFRARLYHALGVADGSDLETVFADGSAVEWERWALAHDLPIAAISDRGQVTNSDPGDTGK